MCRIENFSVSFVYVGSQTTLMFRIGDILICSGVEVQGDCNSHQNYYIGNLLIRHELIKNTITLLYSNSWSVFYYKNAGCWKL